MIGDSMLPWFDLFSGMTVYEVSDCGNSDNQGWVNINEYILAFERSNLLLNGKPYTKNDNREEELVDALISNANILCQFGLIEKNRGTHPPRLEYRVTNKGKKFDSLRGSFLGNFRRKYFFFWRALKEKLKKYKIIITVAAFGMAVVNAVKFTILSVAWLTDFWGIVSSFIAVSLIAVSAMLYS